MPSTAVQNPPVQTESKSAKKKKAKAERTDSPAPSALSVPEKAGSVAGQESQDDSSESPYVRELQKNIRNLNKKISNASKTDSIIEQHKDKSLDDLVNAKIINADQRAQRLKKPQLEAQLAQLEEQLAQYKKVDEEYRARAAADKASLEKSLVEKFEKEKADAINELKEQAAAEAQKVQKVQHDSLLILSQFLRLAAARRTEEADAGLDENMALEGVLLNVYSGDENAVSTMIKLIEGSEEKTTSVSGEELQTTFAQVKAASAAHASLFAAEATEVTEAPVEITNGTDPTVAHAGLTEIDSTGATIQLTNGHTEAASTPSAPENADVADDAANAAAESQWDANNDLSASVSQEEWVKVPRDPTETETGLTATPAAAGNVQSWADEQPENPPDSRAPAEANDGFHQVQRNRPRGDREGGWRGGRGRGDYRGGWRGHGEGRGRGRGRGRGGMGRGGRPRTTEES
ncbi:hypothetical protein F4811DRAFT_498126 [Daldinia bambusicola]|nr:hypothetical protein F4811DRAFT_498126 [Daldinia bambusicola]